MNIFVFGSSLTSTYWNGAATYYRGIYKQLYRLGHRIVFAAPDVYGRQTHQDGLSIDYATVRIYQSPEDIPSILRAAAAADIVIKHSGLGADDALLEKSVLDCAVAGAKVIFWDVDAPATLARLDADRTDPFRLLIPKYDAILTYGGGPPIVAKYLEYRAKLCVPIYNGLDPETHHPVAAEPEFICDLAFIGHRLPDRESRVTEFFFNAASHAPSMSFLLGGEGWGGKPMPSNVRWIGHVPSDKHNVLNCSAKIILNINRGSMAAAGFSPPTRIFEAAGAGACVITDVWEGIDQFFSPESEILCAGSGQEVAKLVSRVTRGDATVIGGAMRERALREHTYDLRAREVHERLQQLCSTDKYRQSEKENATQQTPLVGSCE